MTRTERREARDDLKTEIEEIDADMIGWREEIRMLKEQIAEAKARRVELKLKHAELRERGPEPCPKQPS